MNELERIEKDKISSFIESNDLDYTVMDSDVFVFSLLSMDNMQFKIYKQEESYLLMKCDLEKIRQYNEGNVMLEPYSYFNFNNLSQMLEQIKLYDDNIPKSWWSPVADVMNYGIKHYTESWYEEFVKDGFIIEKHGQYEFLSFTSKEYKPELKSPFNTLHEVSELNKLEYTSLDELHIEIQPISCVDRNESYLFKIQCNSDQVFKEYINYVVSRKKGLRILIKETFTIMEKFKTK